MAENESLPSPKENHHRRPAGSSLFGSPRLLFTGFTSNVASSSVETETVMSPTSILDDKTFSAGLRNSPFRASKSPSLPESRRPIWDKLDSQRIGLGIVDALADANSGTEQSIPETRMVLFGSQLKIQIPVPNPDQMDFFSHGLSLSPVIKPVDQSSSSSGLSVKEMGLSEDYTCVISHGPNPKTIHIFDDCIVESCCGVFSLSRTENELSHTDNRLSFPSNDFLMFCHTCKKSLGQGKDIYMYRGEQAFCSSECRYQEMLMEEGMNKN